MSDWKRSDLCLCQAASISGHCVHTEKSQLSDTVHLHLQMARETALPLQDICTAAMARRLKTKQTQILILHDISTRELVKQEVDRIGVFMGQSVELCTLDQIDHVDLLQALAMGFDRVFLQNLREPEAKAILYQEVDLARELGGNGRLELFSNALRLRDALSATPRMSGRWKFEQPEAAVTRRATVRACAEVLLPSLQAPIPLPSDAPHGSVSLDVSACTSCHSCVWLCPTGALSVDDDTSELLMVENLCIQCGICCSVCPTDALVLVPRMDLRATARTKQVLQHDAPVKPSSSGQLPIAKSTRDRLLTWIMGERSDQPPVNRQKRRLPLASPHRKSQGSDSETDSDPVGPMYIGPWP